MSSDKITCQKCGFHLTERKAGQSVPRTECCPKCSADIHSCIHCRHHDQAAYNECRETQADRVVDKERSNFCDYFSLMEGLRKNSQKKAAGKALSDLDDLFK